MTREQKLELVRLLIDLESHDRSPRSDWEMGWYACIDWIKDEIKGILKDRTHR